MNGNDRTTIQIIGSILLGIITSFIITYILGIELNDTVKIIFAIGPPIVVSLWAIKNKRIRSVRLCGIVSHGVAYGFINLIAENTFFKGLESIV